MTDPLTLMQWQAAALYTSDAGGRLTGINEPGNSDPAPRFFLGRTPAGNVWNVRDDVPDTLAAKLDALCRQEPVLTLARSSPPTIATEVYHLLGPVVSEYRGPAYWLAAPQTVPASALQITTEQLERLRPHFPAFLEHDFASQEGPVAISVAGGVAVALCTCARLTSVVAEPGVRTAPEFRGQGHAAAAVALWASLVAASGRMPLYSTSWDNLASQRVAARLGAMQYGEDWSLR